MTGPMRDASEVIAGWSEHDRKIMADIEAMAANRHNGFWPSAIAQSALRIIHREATPQPASADVVDARRYRVMRDGAVLLSRPPAPGAFPITRLGSVDGKMLHGEELDEMCDAALELVPVVEGRE